MNAEDFIIIHNLAIVGWVLVAILAMIIAFG